MTTGLNRGKSMVVEFHRGKDCENTKLKRCKH
jgi:hypothetical protein